MIICFNCSAETKKALDDLLTVGQYSNYSEIIELAISNLTLLHKEISQNGAVIIRDEGNSPKRENSQRARKQGAVAKPSKNPSKFLKQRVYIPDVFRLEGIKGFQPALAAKPSDGWSNGQDIPLDQWLFGQQSKYLPLKASCRALVHFLIGRKEGINLRDISNEIAEQAAVLGGFLSQLDKQFNLKRGNELSVGFPPFPNPPEKSTLRYGSQYIAGVNKQGQVSGLLFGMKMVNVLSPGKVLISLTEEGWQFAMIENPILDDDSPQSYHRLSEAESTFLIKHILNNVPIENFACRLIIRAIKEGCDTPESINKFLRNYANSTGGARLRDPYINTQRYGVMSRMTELNLISKLKVGLGVSFEITPRGSKYFD